MQPPQLGSVLLSAHRAAGEQSWGGASGAPEQAVTRTSASSPGPGSSLLPASLEGSSGGWAPKPERCLHSSATVPTQEAPPCFFYIRRCLQLFTDQSRAEDAPGREIFRGAIPAPYFSLLLTWKTCTGFCWRTWVQAPALHWGT